MMYDTIIIGAGAAGLFCAAHMTDKNKRVLVLESSSRVGLKLLVSGGGQCNFTHGGSMTEYLDKYGKNGRKIRKVLNTYTNQDVVNFFEKSNLKTWEREDGKVFPASKKAKDVLDVLLKKIEKNNIEIRKNVKVEGLIENREEHIWNIDAKVSAKENNKIVEQFRAKNIVIATGGITYPKTGSDGNMFHILKKLGAVEITEPMPALTPIFVEGYPFEKISGVSIKNCCIEKIQDGVKKKDRIDNYQDDILFTHKNLSGPVILNFSRYLNNGDRFKINFIPNGFVSGDHLPYKGCKKNLLNLLVDETGLAKAFLEVVIMEAGRKINMVSEKLPSEKSASLSGKLIKAVEELLCGWEFIVSKKGGVDVAMVTTGGVKMSQVSPSTMESKKHPGLHFAGEILDVDGNTGGYNIQFAFSSSYIAAQHILQLP